MNRGVIAPGNHLFRIRCAEHHPADHAAIFRYEKSRIMRLLREYSYTLSIRDRRRHASALHCVSKISALNYNLQIHMHTAPILRMGAVGGF